MTTSAEGARSFLTSGDAYDAYMGRYSRALAPLFADAAGVRAGQQVLDAGCGPGALTGELVRRVGATNVRACDPSPPFVADCAARHPGVDVRAGRLEEIPFGDDLFDVAMAQLVLHFVTDPDRGAAELHRVLHPGGTVAACVWDFDEGMQMLRFFWDAALAIDPSAPDEARTLRFGREGELCDLFSAAGFVDVAETTLELGTTYASFDELWNGYLLGIGPAGTYCLSLSDEQRAGVRDELFRRAGSPSGAISLSAKARCATGRRGA